MSLSPQGWRCLPGKVYSRSSAAALVRTRGRGVGSRSSWEPRLWEDLPPSGSPNHPGHLQIGNHTAMSLTVLAAPARGPPTLHSQKPPFIQQSRCGRGRRKARAWPHTSRLGSLVPLWSELAGLCPSGDLVWLQGRAGASCWLAAGSSAGPAAGKPTHGLSVVALCDS